MGATAATEHNRSINEWENKMIRRALALTSVCLFGVSNIALADSPRARDIGPLQGKPGALNAITDVQGVEVGQVTLIKGDGALQRGKGPVRTGVTAIIPRGKNSTAPVYAAWNTSNAAGEMTGTVWLEERGYLDGPIMITNTHSVGVVRDAVVGWIVDHKWPGSWFTLMVAAMGRLGDISRESSGDIFMAFSTANPQLNSMQMEKISVETYPNPLLNPLFEGVVQATEEAILNALAAAKTMTGRDGHRVYGLPHDEVRAIVSRNGAKPQ